jgi:long-chain acyl-CoA synthetase
VKVGNGRGPQRRTSTADLLEAVRDFSLGLRELGLGPGQRVGILAAPSPYWVIADLGVMIAGGVSVPIFSSSSTRQIEYQQAHSAMRFLVVGGVASRLAATPIVEKVERVIGRGLSKAAGNGMDFDAVLRRGRQADQKDTHAFEWLCGRVRPDDVATIIYTSGSTGTPKGVALTHGNLASQVTAAGQRFDVDEEHDVALSFLPLAHVFERMILYFYLQSGVTVYFADNIKKVGELMREVKPTVMTVVPRLLEKIHDRIVIQVEEAHGVRGQLARWALAKAETQAEARAGDAIADALMFSRFREALGGRLRIVVSGGAALSEALCRFYWNIGVPLYNGYGLTECSPVVCTNYPEGNRVGSVGRPFPGVEVRTNSQGVLEVRGPNVMRGYLDDPDATAEVTTEDGWLVTGDIALIDDEGYVRITGRLKEMFKTSTGKYVCPIPIERELCRSPVVDQAMVVADGRRFVTSLIFPDHDTIALSLGGNSVDEKALKDYISGDDYAREVQEIVDRINIDFNRWERVQRFRVIAEAPSTDNQQLTPTAKLRRHIVEDVYSAEIDEMYRGGGT